MKEKLEKFLIDNPEFVHVCKDVSSTVSPIARRKVLIGAWARTLNLDCYLPMDPRGTRDFDFYLVLDGWSDYEKVRDRMETSGFKQRPNIPHRFEKRRVIVDLLPYSEKIVIKNRLLWPGTDIEMSYSGTDDALKMTWDMNLGSGLSLEVVNTPGLVLLKINSYLDRPKDRPRDLVDIFFAFHHYKDGLERMEFGPVTMIDSTPILYESMGDFLLGHDIGVVINNKEAANRIREFCGKFSNEESEIVYIVSSIFGQPWREDDKKHEILKLIRSFHSGVQCGIKNVKRM